MGARRIEIDHELAQGHDREIDDGVNGKDDAAVLVRGLFVEPAFDDHEQRRQAITGDRAHDPPHARQRKQAMGQRGGRGDRHHRREAADVADAAHQIGGEEAPGGEARVIGRAQDADIERGKGLDLRAQGQQRRLQPVAHQQDGRAEEQRRDLCQRGAQDPYPPPANAR